jgi:alkylation response protein AidB-like acyl-CoA dehydrogenase
MGANAGIVASVREFVESDVRPVAAGLEHADHYPHDLVARMRDLGLFGALVPIAYGGLGLDVTTYARVIEELCRGWMSLAGVINSHTMAALIVLQHGTEEQRTRFLPRFARGEARGGLCLTEPHAGSDVQAIRTTARRRGDDYVVNGTKMFVTNGREGNTFALLAVTDSAAAPRHRGMSCFVVEKGDGGLRVAQSIGKLGYKGVDTAELVFEDYVVPAANLVGGVAGRGFKHVMSGLEAGRINIAARAVGVGQAAMDEALRHVRSGDVEPHAVALADMATKLAGARLLTYWAADMKDRGERCDLEAGMAKLAASEAAQELAESGLRIHGEAGQLTTLPAERLYRDTPLMIIGEGSNASVSAAAHRGDTRAPRRGTTWRWRNAGSCSRSVRSSTRKSSPSCRNTSAAIAGRTASWRRSPISASWARSFPLISADLALRCRPPRCSWRSSPADGRRSPRSSSHTSRRPTRSLASPTPMAVDGSPP